jgi:hypothetical protein
MGATRGGLLLAVLTQVVTQACGPALVDPVHRSTVDQTKGYESLLIWAADFHRTAVAACGRRAALYRRRAAAAGGAPPEHRRRPPKRVLSAPNLTGQGPKERGEHKELTERLGPEEGSPEKEIGRRGGAPAVSSGGGAVAVREERRGGARDGEEALGHPL